jgi:hypothetical protein
MSDDQRNENVYGENHPASEDRREPGIRDRVAKEQSTAKTLDQTRDEDVESGENSGGMGRENTPRDGKTQGTWERPNDAEKR